MTITDFLSHILSPRGAVGLAALLSLVQIAPIKINPWSWLLRIIGKMLNGEVIEKVGDLEEDIKEIKQVMGETEAKTARVRILRFNDELLRKERHSKDHFDQTLADIDDYEHYCSEHPKFRNNMTVMATENIKACYRKCLDQHDFL